MDYIPGQRVRTNDLYYQKNKRHVVGEIISPKIKICEGNSIVRWVEQSGETIEEFNGVMVIMSNKYLESF